MNRRFLVFFLLFVATVGAASIAQAQATRTWVSGVGDDANPCSRTAPCKTFAGAISKTAASGIISVLDPGGFGAVTITKSITIDGTGQIAGTLAVNTNGIIISNAIPANWVVTLRNIDIHGANSTTSANGVNVLAAATGELNVQECRIQNFVNDGIRVANSAGTVAVNITTTDIANNLRGVEVIPSGAGIARVAINDSTISGNGASGIDVAVNNGSATVFGSMISHNGTGVQVQATSATAFIDTSTLAYNGTGINSGLGVATPVTRIAHSSIVGSTTNGIAGTGTVVGFSSNMIVGNAGSNSVSSSAAQQ